MEYANCRKCGKLFAKISSSICQDCVKAEEEQFSTLKNYISDNPMATLPEIAEKTKIHPKRIMQYLREGRLEVKGSFVDELRCVSCGASIKIGTHCKNCLTVIQRDLKEAIEKGKVAIKKPEEVKKEKAGMHIMKKEKK